MSDYWPIPVPIRTGVINYAIGVALNAEKPRDQLTACRIVLTASLLNLRYRQLPQPLPVRHKIPKATRKEYEEMLNADELYLNYLHDWQICLAGYPPGHTLKYLPFPRISGVTPQTVRDPSLVQPKVFPEDKHLSWDDCDLWPIKKEYREPLMNTLLRLVTLKDNLPVSLGAARTMLTASSINLRYQKAGDIKPPYAPEPVPDPSERDFSDLVFVDGQYQLFQRDVEMSEDGYPPGETFMWTHSPMRITGKTVCWDRLNKYITKNKLVVEDGW